MQHPHTVVLESLLKKREGNSNSDMLPFPGLTYTSDTKPAQETMIQYIELLPFILRSRQRWKNNP